MSTRRVPELGAGVDFDHGAQYFTVRSEELGARLPAWIERGVVRPWEGRIVAIGPEGLQEKGGTTDRFVGSPAMNAICRDLARSLEVRYQARVRELRRKNDAWTLVDDDGATLGEFDFIAVSAPAPQTAALLEEVAPSMANKAASVRMKPCWAVLTAFEPSLDVSFDGAFVNTGPLSWVARTSSKPQRRASPERWVLHAGPEWSSDHLEEPPRPIVASLLEALFEALETKPRRPSWAQAHRWRFALAERALEEGSLFDATLGIGACGDWANGDRVEGAWCSGLDLARRVLAEITRPRAP